MTELRVSLEWKLVVSGAKAALDGAEAHRVDHDLLNAPIDWRRVAALAREHRVAPLLYSTLQRLAPPPASNLAVRSVKQLYLATAARNAVLFQALERILRALTGGGTPVIVLKGAALADTVYPQRALRPMNDIDLLIHEEDLETAEAQLRRVGYEVAHDLETKERLRRRHHHWVFRNAKPILSGIPLELHWALDPPGWPFRVDLEALWQRATPTRAAGGTALGLAPEDLLLHLCTHACRHRFNGGLITLCDITAAIAHYDDRIDWPQLEARAAEWQAGPYVFMPLQLAFSCISIASLNPTSGVQWFETAYCVFHSECRPCEVSKGVQGSLAFCTQTSSN